jgi:hypothetical protein
MKLIELNHHIFKRAAFNANTPVDTKPLVAVMERCAELGYTEVVLEVGLGFAIQPAYARLDYRRTDPATLKAITHSQELSSDDAVAITLAAAAILAHSRDEAIEEVHLNCAGTIPLSNGENTQLFVGSGLIFPQGYHLFLRAPYLQPPSNLMPPP